MSIIGTSFFPGAYDEQLTYDRNGNILSLLRHTGDANENQIGMDNLAYTYQNGNQNSNRLMKVTDAVSGSSTGGFSNGSSGNSNDYTYDENGNMISDLNKGITEILYNHLNLPILISFANGNSIEYLYNAAGQKVKKTVHNMQNNTIKIVDYLDGFQTEARGSRIPVGAKATQTKNNEQYAGGILQFFPTSEGYVAATESTELLNPYIYNYVYNYTDHLGNIRLSYTKDPVSGELEIMEENHYYPFGLKHAVYAAPKQMYKLDEEEENMARPAYVYETEYQYKHQGQERQDELSLNWDCFKWRNYDYAIGRFMSIDPLSDLYVDWGPYVFSGNRVVDARELEGLEPKSVVKKEGDGYKFTKPATYLLSQITGVNFNLIENTTIKRRTGLSMPWANAKKGGGAATLKGQITYTKNYFSGWNKSSATFGGNDALSISEWLLLSSHEVGHLSDAESLSGFNYFITFLVGYISSFGHDKYSKEIEAELGRIKLKDFYSVVGEFNVMNIFLDESLTDEEKINQLNVLIGIYNFITNPPPLIMEDYQPENNRATNEEDENQE